MLDRHHLQQIKKIDELGSLTQAANTLFITQSALSHSMKKLENSLGIQIWRKSGRRLILTQHGQRLLKAANKILPQFEKLESDIAAMATGQGGELKLGIECYPCFQWLLKVVGPFLKKHENVDVDIKNQFQFGGLGALLNFEIDLLLTPDPLHNANVEYIPVFEYELVLVVANGDELASKSHIEPADLQQRTLYTYPVEQSRLDIFSQFLTPSGYSVKHHKTMETTEMIVQMVECGRGVAALPNWLLSQVEQSTSVRKIAIGESGIHKTTYVALRKGEKKLPLINSFIKSLLKNG